MTARKPGNHLRQFASDNYAGICPEVESAMEEANIGHAVSYGADSWSSKADKLFQDLFETDCEVFFVFNGTAANSLAVASLSDTFHSVLCHQFAHIESDECGAPGFFSHGTQLVTVPGKDGKLNARVIEETVTRRDDIHHPKPKVISLTQATELGTVYSVDELKSISRVAKKLDLFVHMDGARFANALAELKVAPRKITWEVGVDVLCFGGTKNGMAFGEAIIFFDRQLARNFAFRRKQGGQLASKMRFLAAQWIGLLRNDAWLRYASHSNRMAKELEKSLKSVRGIKVAFPRQANSVFVEMPSPLIKKLHQRGWHFYTDVGPGGLARFMCAWDTRIEDIDALAKDIQELVKT
jgi:threonine aldolase